MGLGNSMERKGWLGCWRYVGRHWIIQQDTPGVLDIGSSSVLRGPKVERIYSARKMRSFEWVLKLKRSSTWTLVLEANALKGWVTPKGRFLVLTNWWHIPRIIDVKRETLSLLSLSWMKDSVLWLTCGKEIVATSSFTTWWILICHVLYHVSILFIT